MSLMERLVSNFDVFSRRERARGQRYKPDEITAKVRAHFMLFYRDLVNGELRSHSHEDYTYPFWEQMHNKLQHLYGRVYLSNLSIRIPGADVVEFLQRCNPEEFFDFIELSFKLKVAFHVMHDENEVVDAVNEIFSREDVPYRLTPMIKLQEKEPGPFWGSEPATIIRIAEYPKIVRADEEIIHKEALEPALAVLGNPHLEAANKEFREAMNHYRKGEYEDCLTKCGSAFESVLKVLCKRKGWKYSERDTTGKLLDVVFSNSTLYPFLKEPIKLIATIRNRLSSSHGAGNRVRNVERHIGQYGLTSTAAAIVLLVHEIGV